MDKLSHCILLSLQHQVISTKHSVRSLEKKVKGCSVVAMGQLLAAYMKYVRK